MIYNDIVSAKQYKIEGWGRWSVAQIETALLGKTSFCEGLLF
jgi:hypothetical protein